MIGLTQLSLLGHTVVVGQLKDGRPSSLISGGKLGCEPFPSAGV